MDPFRPTFPSYIPPVNVNINDSPTQENTINWRPGMTLTQTQLQHIQAHATQAAYASFISHQLQANFQTPTQYPLSNTPPNSINFRPHFPTPSFDHNHVNETPPVQSNSVETIDVPPKTTRNNGGNWKHIEDKALCEAWIHRSENPIIGTGQTGESLWQHIFEDFCIKQPGTKRTKKGLESRWSSIQKDVTKWRGIVSTINRNHQSGTNIADELGACYESFKAKNNNKDFKFYHCWLILQHSPKWRLHGGENSGVRSFSRTIPVNANLTCASPMNESQMNDSIDMGLDGLDDGGVFPSTTNHVDGDSPIPDTHTNPCSGSVHTESLPRPIGRKSAKKKRQDTATDISNEKSAVQRKLSEQLSDWMASQDKKYHMDQQTKKSQFEVMKSDNDLKTFHQVKQSKLDHLRSAIESKQSRAEFEAKIYIQAPHLMTEEVMQGQILRLKKLQKLETEIDDLLLLEYSPVGSSSRWMNQDEDDTEACNLENRFSTANDSDDIV